MSVSVGVTGVWSRHKSAPWRERWQGCEAWPLLGQPLFHGPALRHRSAELEAESRGKGSKQSRRVRSGDQHLGRAEDLHMWESTCLAHALAFSWRENARTLSRTHFIVAVELTYHYISNNICILEHSNIFDWTNILWILAFLFNIKHRSQLGKKMANAWLLYNETWWIVKIK